MSELRFSLPAKTGSSALGSMLGLESWPLTREAATKLGSLCENRSLSPSGHGDNGREWLVAHPQGTLAQLVREPCERFVSSYNYARPRLQAMRGQFSETKVMLIDRLVDAQTALGFARLLLNDSLSRGSWLSPPDNRRVASRMCTDKKTLGQTCGFVPQAWYVAPHPAARVRLGCLPCIASDVRRVTDDVLGPGCDTLPARVVRPELLPVDEAPPSTSTSITPSVVRGDTEAAAALCAHVSALYKEDSALWHTACAARVRRGCPAASWPRRSDADSDATSPHVSVGGYTTQHSSAEVTNANHQLEIAPDGSL